jgi:hypothetical protein
LLLTSVGVGLVAGVAYIRTLYPGVGPTDSGELTLAAWTLGVAHAPGMPGYVLTAWAWTHLVGVGSVAWRVSLLSAVSAAITAALLTFASYQLAREVGGRHGPSLAGAVFAGLMIACGSDIWHWAVVTEVYAFNSLVVAGVLAILIANRTGRGAAMAAGALFGLGLSVHYVSTLLVAPLVVAWIIQSDSAVPTPDRPSRSRLWITVWGASAAAGIAMPLYLMMMIRARQQPLVNWGAPDTLSRLWAHITAQHYQTNVRFAPGATWDSLVVWWTSSTPVATVLGIWGWWTVQRKTGRWGWAVAVATAVGLFAPYGARFDEVPDLYGYVLPLQLLTGLAIPAGILALVEKVAGGTTLDRRRERLRAAKARRPAPAGTKPGGTPRSSAWEMTTPLAACAFALLLMPFEARRSDRSRDTRSSDFVTNAVEPVASNALILTGDWELSSPLSYRQILEGFRLDVIAIDFLLWQSRPWYIDQFTQRHPDLAAAWQPSLDQFLVELRRFDVSEPYDRLHITSGFRDLIGRMLTTTGRAVYLDLDAVRQLAEKGVRPPAVLVPEGLLFRVSGPPGTAALAPARWRLGSMLDSTLPDDPAADQIALTYVSMLEERARYLSSHGLARDSREAADLARRLDRRGFTSR